MCWEYGGLISQDPRPYSLRELARMAGGKLKHDWDIGAELICATINVHLGKDSEPIHPWQIHPYRSREDYLTEPPEHTDPAILRALGNGHATKH